MVSIVVPMYNEQKVIRATLDELSGAMERMCGGDYEIVVVDDGSGDAGPEIVRAYGGAVRLLSYGENRGKGCAVRTGMLDAKGDYIFFCDADLAYGTQVMEPMLGELKRSGCDVVIISRKLDADAYRSYPFLRKVASRGLSIVVRALLKISVSDTQAGLKAFTREAAGKIFPRCEIDGFAFDFEALKLAEDMGMSIAEVPGRIINHNDTKIRMVRDSVRVFRDILKVRRLHGKKSAGRRG